MDPDDRYENADELKNDLCNQTDIKNWKDFLHAIPGYRTGNIYVEVLATLGYLFAGFVLSILIEVGMKSFQNAFVVVFLLINVTFWYIFGFDCFGFRTKCGYVERYRDNGLKYFFSILFFMASFTIMTFLTAMIIIGLFFV